jgi:hypothetical protein
LLVTCSVDQQGHVHQSLPHPAAFAIGGVVLYNSAISAFSFASLSSDSG